MSTAGANLAGLQDDFWEFHLHFLLSDVSYKGEPLSELPDWLPLDMPNMPVQRGEFHQFADFHPHGFPALEAPESLFYCLNHRFTSDFRLWFPSFGISPSVFSKSFFLLTII